jgi:hypothetical protein
MTEHRVKSWPEFYGPLADGQKPFDLRRMDRDYKVGDIIVFCEWKPLQNTNSGYTGRECRRLITYIMDGLGSVGTIEPYKGLARGYGILGLAEIA